MEKGIKFWISFFFLTVSFFSFYIALFIIYAVIGKLDVFITISYNKAFFIILILTALAVTFSYLFSTFIRKKIKNSVNNLLFCLKEINGIDDLEKIDLVKLNLFFKEYNHILSELEKFFEKIKKLAIDKKDFEKMVSFIRVYAFNVSNIQDESNLINIFYSYFSSQFKGEAVFYSLGSDRKLRYFVKENERFVEKENTFLEEFLKTCAKSDYLFYEEELELNNNKRYIYFKVYSDVPLWDECIVGTVVSEKLDKVYVNTIIESLITLMFNFLLMISILKRSIKEIEFLSIKDPLTNLFNKNAFLEIFEDRIKSEPNSKLCLLLIDIDNFKYVNYSYGYHFGDFILEETSKLICKYFDKHVAVCRYSGDKFALLLDNYGDGNYVIDKVIGFKNNFSNHLFELGELKISGLTLSTSIAFYPDNADNSKDLLIFAETLISNNRKKNKNMLVFSERCKNVSIFKEDSGLSLKIAEAIKNKHIKLYFQPIVDLKENKYIGYEVLTKLIINELLIQPDRFLPLLDKLGLTYDFDIVVIESVFCKFNWKNVNEYFFINVHSRTLQNTNFINCLMSLMEFYNVNPEKVVFEITERDAVENLEYFVNICEILKGLRLKLALDDFGSGFSSFTFVKSIPAEFVKLEGEFIKGLKNNKKDSLIVDAIVNICKSSDIKIIAEYIEDADTLKKAISKLIDYGQGFYLGKPEDDIEKNRMSQSIDIFTSFDITIN